MFKLLIKDIWRWREQPKSQKDSIQTIYLYQNHLFEYAIGTHPTSFLLHGKQLNAHTKGRGKVRPHNLMLVMRCWSSSEQPSLGDTHPTSLTYCNWSFISIQKLFSIYRQKIKIYILSTYHPWPYFVIDMQIIPLLESSATTGQVRLWPKKQMIASLGH